MKIKRHKRVRKVLLFYKNNFGINPPYKILLDGTFCKAALTFQVNIREQMPKYLDAEVKLLTTDCILAECKQLGSLLYGPLKVLEQFDTVPCGHPAPLSGAKCLFKVACKQSGGQYFVASQDREVSDKVRDHGGIPLIFISHNAITLEQPSMNSQNKASDKLSRKMAPSEQEGKNIKTSKQMIFGDAGPPKKKKRKGPRGANPLSCKKKKVGKKSEGTSTSSSESNKSKRKRKRRKAIKTVQTGVS